MFFEVKHAEYLKDYQIILEFEDGLSGVADLSNYPNPDNVFKKFIDNAYFRDFKVEFGTLSWGNGELDLAPEHLYQLVTGRAVFASPEQNVI